MTDEKPQDELDEVIVRAMRAEVPEPGSTYWDDIDAMLIENAVVDHGSRDPALVDPAMDDDGIESPMDTGGRLVRLTDMNKTTPTFRRDLLSRAAVVLALVGLVGLAAFTLTRGGDSPGEDDVASSPDTTGETSTTTPDVERSTTTVDETASSLTTIDDVPAPSPDVQAFTVADVEAAGLETIGCWMRRDDSDDPIFFNHFDGDAFMVIDGTPLELVPAGDALPIEFGAVTKYEAAGYAIEFTEVGEPVEDSIESTVRDVTLQVTNADGDTNVIAGSLGCGV